MEDTHPAPRRIGLVQMSCGEDPHRNLDRAESLVREAAADGANVICLPELFRTRYPCQAEDERCFELAEPIPGPTTEKMASLARDLGVVLVVPVFEKRAPGLYHNSASVLDADGSLLGSYRKMHIPDDPGFYEKYYFTPGDLGYRAWKTRFGTIGVCICWDQWFPEAARLTTLQGAEILFYPTAIGWLPAEKEEVGATQHASWQITQRAHGIANGCHVAAANRTGFEDSETGGIDFWGQTFVSGPDGSVCGELSATEEGVLVVEAPVSATERQRVQWPFLRDRRVDSYSGLLKLHGSK